MSIEWPSQARLKSGLRRAGSAAFAFSARSLQQITTFVLTLLAARFLAPAEYGVYTLSILFVTFLQTLIFTGFFHYAIRAKGDSKEIVDTCFWLTLALSIFGATVFFFGAPFFARIFHAPDMKLVLQLLALIQPIVALTAWSSSVLMRENRLRLHFRLMAGQNIISLIGGVIIIFMWHSVFALVAHRLLRAAVGALLYLVFNKVTPGFDVRRAIVKDAIGFSHGLYGSRILTFISNYGADLALGLMLSTAEAGLYRFGNRLATGAIDIVVQPMQSFAMTQFGAAHRADRAFGPIVERFSSSTLVLAGCVAGTIYVFGEDIVNLFFQPAYAGGLVVAYALSARALFALGGSYVEPVLAAAGYTGKVLAYSGRWTVVQTATIPLVVGFGLGPLAWSRALIAIAATWEGLILMSRTCGIMVRPILEVMVKATIFVLGYTLLAALVRMAAQAELGTGTMALIVGLVGSGLIGLMTVLFAIYWRALDLRVFAG